MLGLFDILNMGARAMDAQQTAVEVTGQNLANVNNPAYSRQRVNLQTTPDVSAPGVTEGTGVEIANIQQLRDTFLDGQIRNEASVGGYWNSQQSALNEAQTQLGEFLTQGATANSASSGDSASTQSLSTQLDGLFNAFESVATDPTSITQRQALVNQAQSLASGFNQASSQLSSLNGDLNQSLGDNVSQANQLLSSIATLNQQIVASEAGGGNANDLRDTREQNLEKLANLVNINTSTDTRGQVDISIGGTQLVSGNTQLDSLQTYDPGNGQLLVRTATGGTPLTLSGGAIQGTIDARDGALATLRSGLDSIASSLITQVNSVYSAGYSLNGTTGDNFFTGTDAGTIGVNTALQNDPSQIQAASAANTPGDNSVALALANLGQQPNAALNNETFTDAYSVQVENLGNAVSNANNQVTNYNSVSTMMQAQRESVSGVSLDEEMTNLITFQQAYEASARIVSTVDQMLQTVVALKQ
jgi:flagellar hook-associated protein 1